MRLELADQRVLLRARALGGVERVLEVADAGDGADELGVELRGGVGEERDLRPERADQLGGRRVGGVRVGRKRGQGGREEGRRGGDGGGLAG